MRVAIFTDNDFEKVNGVTTTLRAVIEHAPADIEPRIYTCEARDVDRPEYLALGAPGVGIPFYREMKMYWPPVGRFARKSVADGIELIHLTTPGPVGLAAMRVSAMRRTPMVGSFHTDLAAYTALLSGSARLGWLMGQYMRWPYGRCARILAPSEATRSQLAASGIPKEKVGLWTRGVSVDRFTPERRSPALRAAWGATDRRPVLLYVGRISREKGLDALPRLCRRLLHEGIDHRWVIVGDGPYRRELSMQLDAEFTGTLSPSAVATTMASADVFVFPSRTDTAGNVVLEAQASGLPVVVTSEGGPQENMVHRQTGYVCHDEWTFFARLAELTSNRNRRAYMAQNARAYADTRRWETALAPLFDAYREVGAAALNGIRTPPATARLSPAAIASVKS